MENILGWVVILSFPIGVIIGVYKLIKYRERKQVERHNAEWEQINTRAARDREFGRKSIKQNATSPRTGNKFSSVGSSPVNTGVTTTSTASDSLLSDMAMLYVLNSALQHGSASASVDYDSGTIKTDNSSSPTWGLDDEDSRKSAFSSFSDSTGGWSNSDSSSSSDSGPSSDW